MVEYWDGTGVDIHALKAEVIRLGTEFPDKQVGCVYSTADGEPVCIIGQAVFNITGKVVSNVTWWGQVSNSDQWVSALGGQVLEYNLGFSTEGFAAFQFVARVQGHQDIGHTWSEALAHARAWEQNL